MTEVTVRRVGEDEARTCVFALADVLVDCVEGGASVGFLRPLAHDRAVAFWSSRGGQSLRRQPQSP